MQTQTEFTPRLPRLTPGQPMPVLGTNGGTITAPNQMTAARRQVSYSFPGMAPMAGFNNPMPGFNAPQVMPGMTNAMLAHPGMGNPMVPQAPGFFVNAQNQPVPLVQRFQGVNDAHLGFALSQAAYIEREVYKIRYDDIQYHDLVPVDTRAHDWARTITHFSQDSRGKMKPVSGKTTDFPLVELDHNDHNVTVEMFGIGYGWDIQEMGQAGMVGLDLAQDKAMTARRLSEEHMDEIVLYGSSTYGWDSLLKSNLATRGDVAQGATGSNAVEKRKWINKTAEEIILDINTLIQGVYTDTNTVDLCNTLLVPPNIWAALASKVLDGTSETVTSFIKRSNVYTMKTGRSLLIREVNGLESAGGAGHDTGGRMVAYKRDREVLRLHLPMAFQFMPMQQQLMAFMVPGILRTAGLEIRLSKLIRYGDGIS